MVSEKKKQEIPFFKYEPFSEYYYGQVRWLAFWVLVCMKMFDKCQWGPILILMGSLLLCITSVAPPRFSYALFILFTKLTTACIPDFGRVAGILLPLADCSALKRCSAGQLSCQENESRLPSSYHDHRHLDSHWLQQFGLIQTSWWLVRK